MAQSAASILHADTPILIADDSYEFAQVLNKLLAGIFNYRNINTVASADEALERILKNPNCFRLLFADFHFPFGLNGGELLIKLSESNVLEGRYAFLMSSDPNAEALQNAQVAGAVGVITKPFDRDELRRQLNAAEQRALSDPGLTF